GEQRQRCVAERLQRPQPAAAVETQRAQRISRGKAFEHGAAKPAAPPQIMRIGVTEAARREKTLGIGLGQALDLAQPEAQHPPLVIPAEAGIHGAASLRIRKMLYRRWAIHSNLPAEGWIPAFAGMTIRV